MWTRMRPTQQRRYVRWDHRLWCRPSGHCFSTGLLSFSGARGSRTSCLFSFVLLSLSDLGDSLFSCPAAPRVKPWGHTILQGEGYGRCPWLYKVHVRSGTAHDISTAKHLWLLCVPSQAPTLWPPPCTSDLAPYTSHPAPQTRLLCVPVATTLASSPAAPRMSSPPAILIQRPYLFPTPQCVSRLAAESLTTFPQKTGHIMS